MTSPAVRVLGLLTGVAALLASVLPPLSVGGKSSGSLFDSGSSMVILLLILIVTPIWGALAVDRPGGVGLVGGAGLIVGTTFMFLVSVFVLLFSGTDSFGAFGVQYDAGFYLMCVAGGLGIVIFFASLGGGQRDGRRTEGAFGVVGVVAALGTTLGIMLPAPDSFLTFKSQNFEFGDAFVQVSWLAFVGSFGLAGAIGFASRTRWGLGLALGSFLPMAWIVVSSLLELERSEQDQIGVSGVLREDIHPILVIAVCAEAAALLLARATMSAAEYVPVDPRLPPPRPDSPESRPLPLSPDSPDSHLSDRSHLSHLPPPPVAPLLPPPAPIHPIPEIATAPVDDDATVRRPRRPPLTLAISDGRSIDLGPRIVLVGRNPVASLDDGDIVVLPVEDASRSVSKTHLAIGLDEVGVPWVEDRHSTNGVVVETPLGDHVSLSPGLRTPLLVGSTITLGGVTLTVDRDRLM